MRKHKSHKLAYKAARRVKHALRDLAFSVAVAR